MDEEARQKALHEYWYSVGQIAYMVGLSVDDACGFPEGHPNRERFMKGWTHSQIHTVWPPERASLQG